MSDELLPYYNRELAYFRRMSRGFAEEHPKIAGRLRLGEDASQDPDVERLIEAFAFLNARTRRKIDDEFPEICDAFLNTLYPHYLAPIPSMCVVQFHPVDGAADLNEIPKLTEINTEPIDGEPCRFRTAYPVDVWPIQLTQARLVRQPAAAPMTPQSGNSAAVLRWKLQALGDAVFSELQPRKLRVFLQGPSHYILHLYELLFNNALEVAVATSADARDPIVLPAHAIQPVGFEPDEGMLPCSARSNPAFRLLSEYFAFPDKFLFLDLDLAAVGAAGQWEGFGAEANVYFFLNRTSVDLEQNISDETFRLGCSPVINLFRQRAEPLVADGTKTEYRLEPDARHPMALEVYSIDHVVAADSDGEERELAPLYSIRHGDPDAKTRGYWHSVRRSTVDDGDDDEGADLHLSFINRESGEIFTDAYIDVETTCFNRNLPNRLPFGGGAPNLYLAEGASQMELECLTAPTPTRRPDRGSGAVWKLISQLTLGRLSIQEGADGADALREILALYDLNPHSETEAVFESLANAESRRAVGRVSGGICRGVEVRVEFEAERFSEKGLYLFASVLDRFLAQQCTMNAFTQLTVLIKGWETPLATWPARSGRKVLA